MIKSYLLSTYTVIGNEVPFWDTKNISEHELFGAGDNEASQRMDNVWEADQVT